MSDLKAKLESERLAVETEIGKFKIVDESFWPKTILVLKVKGHDRRYAAYVSKEDRLVVDEESNFAPNKDKMVDAMNTIWAEIGPDVLVGDDGNPDYRKNMKGTHVREIVADRLVDTLIHGSANLRGEDCLMLMKFWSHLGDKDKAKVLKEAFPFRSYGW